MNTKNNNSVEELELYKVCRSSAEELFRILTSANNKNKDAMCTVLINASEWCQKNFISTKTEIKFLYSISSLMTGSITNAEFENNICNVIEEATKYWIKVLD